jgi:hypothetical protein
VVRAGSTGKVVLVHLRDASGDGCTGLRWDTNGLAVAYARQGVGCARAVDLRPTSLVEVDASLLPGVYRLAVPDDALAPGVERVLLAVRAPGAVTQPIQIELVAYDPHDSVRMGWQCQEESEHREFLRRALPRLTEAELALGHDA